jgi:hypothetical protein
MPFKNPRLERPERLGGSISSDMMTFLVSEFGRTVFTTGGQNHRVGFPFAVDAVVVAAASAAGKRF